MKSVSKKDIKIIRQMCHSRVDGWINDYKIIKGNVYQKGGCWDPQCDCGKRFVKIKINDIPVNNSHSLDDICGDGLAIQATKKSWKKFIKSLINANYFNDKMNLVFNDGVDNSFTIYDPNDDSDDCDSDDSNDDSDDCDSDDSDDCDSDDSDDCDSDDSNDDNNFVDDSLLKNIRNIDKNFDGSLFLSIDGYYTLINRY